MKTFETLVMYFVSIFLIWNIIPMLVVACLPGVPSNHKVKAIKCFISAAFRGVACLIPNFTAPVVVPIALMFTKYEDDSLPKIFSWWNNDVGISGDQPEGTETYYAPGYDRRSFVARFIWLGLRNRASRLALVMGHTYQPGEYDDSEDWGDPKTGRDHEGWALNRRGPVYQLYYIKKLGDKFCFRMNYGFKVWAGEGDKRPTAMVVNITASVLSFKG